MREDKMRGGPGRLVDRVRGGIRHLRRALRDSGLVRRAKAGVMAGTLAASSLMGALSPVAAYGFGYGLDYEFQPITVDVVREDQFEEPGYEPDPFGFTDVPQWSGFEWYDDLSPFYAAVATEDPTSHWSVAKRDGGWHAEIDESTPKGTDFTLRYTGGMYDSTAIDMLVTIADWTYKPGLPEGTKTGISIMKGWRTSSDAEADDPDAMPFESLNFYSIGIAEFVVEIQYVLAGTDVPAEVKGHMTTTDLDFGQSFSFGGSVVKGRISDSTYNQGPRGGLQINEDSSLIYTDNLFGLDDRNPVQYRQGMVETYFDSTSETGKPGEPMKIYFGTSWGAGQTGESIFFLTADYLTAPPTDPTNPVPKPVKTAAPAEGVSVGDRVTFDVDVTMHEENVNCRWGWHYTTCQIVDVLPPQMRYVEGTGRLLDEEGNDVTHLGKVIYDGDDSEPNENTLRFEFDREALKDLDLKGQHYHLVFDAELTEYPDPDEMAPSTDPLKVHNNCYVEVNGDKNPGDEITVELLEPQFSVDKSADDYEWEVGDVVHFTVRYKQTVPNAQSRHTVVSDNLPEYLELIPDSVKATGVKDLPPVEVNANEWSINFDKFNYGDELVVEYDAVVRQSGNGKEIINQASIHAANAPDEDDPEEIWANTANVEVEKDVDRYEGYVGASDQDPGFFEYTVTFRNTQAGTVANDVVITDDSLPEGMRLGRNNDGSLMIMSMTENGTDVAMNKIQDRYEGTLSDIQYRVGEAEGQDPFDGDFVHDQTVTVTPKWNIDPKGTGWEMHLDHLAYGQEIVLVYRAYPEDSVSGWEIENEAEITADNSQPDDDTAIVWVNQPHFAIDKQASNDTFTVNDDITYEVKVTNSTPGTLARNVVISDLARTDGVELDRSSIRVYDSRGEDITDSCTISYKHNPYGAETFIVETHRDLIAGMTDDMRELYERLMACTDEASFDEVYAQIREAVDEQHMGADHDSPTVAIPGRPYWADDHIEWLDGSNPLGVDQQSPRPGSLSCEVELVVCYRVQVQDAELAGQTVDNTALVVSDEPNTATTDDEVVDVKGPRLVIDKTSDKDTYQVGETGHYTLVATQTREDNVAKDVVVSDLMDERDVASIVHGSVRAVGPDGQAIQAEPAYVSDDSGKIVGFTLETGVDLADEQSVTVTYDVTFEKAGTTLHNVAQANATNTVGGTDDNLVRVVDPYAVVTLDKSVDRETVRYMEWATYTIQATVADNPAKNVVISDMSLPDTMPIDMDSIQITKDGVDVTKGSLDWDGNGFSAHLGDCEAGCVITITYKAQVRDRSLMGTSVVNTATLTSDTLEEPLRDDAHVTIPLEEPDVALDKSVDRSQIEVGDTVTYTVRATVAQDAEGVKNVVIGDASLPDAMHIDMASIRAWVNDVELDPVNADIKGNTFSINFGDLRAGETVTITYDATATDESLDGTDVTNVATLTSDSIDDPLEDDAVVHVGEGEPGTDTEPEPGDGPQLVISKDSNKQWFTPLESGRYTLRVTNPAEGTIASDIVVTDELDGDDRALAQIVEGTVKVTDAKGVEVPVSDISYDKSDAGRTYGFTIATGYDLPYDGALYVTYDVLFDGEVNETEPVHNLATASSEDGPSSEADHTVNLDPEGKPELTLDKSADKASVAPGDKLTYTVVVTQPTEGQVATDTVITDDLPDGFTLDQDSVKVEKDGHAMTCDTEFPAGKLRVSLGDVAYDETWTITYSGTVDEDFLGDELTNTVLGESPDIPENPTDETTTPVTDPRLEITKTADRETFRPGEELTWEITVTQTHQGSTATGVIVTDTLPEGFEPSGAGDVTVVDAQGNPRKATVTLVCGKLTAVLGDLAYNDPVTISIPGSVSVDYSDDVLRNTAKAESTSTDPVRDTAEVPSTIAPELDTTITKSVNRTTAHIGDELAYVVRVTTASALPSATITDSGLPDGVEVDLSSVTVKVDGEGLDAKPAESGTGFEVELGDLAAGSEIEMTYTASATDEGLVGESATNVATLSSDGLEEPLSASATVRIVDDMTPSAPSTGSASGSTPSRGTESMPNTGQGPLGALLVMAGAFAALAAAGVYVLRRREALDG